MLNLTGFVRQCDIILIYVLVIGYCILGFIWNLVLDIWDFTDLYLINLLKKEK